MLRITVPSSGQSQLTFNKVEEYNIPAPPNGFDREINNDVILLFDDEQEAIEYARNLEVYAVSLNDDTSPGYLISTDISNTINNDEFVKAYVEN